MMLRKQLLTFKIEPKPCSRPRVGKFGTYYNKTYLKFKNDMKAIIDCQPIMLFEKKLLAHVKFYMPIPKSLSMKKQDELVGKYCDTGGDVDNLLKSIFDALNKIAYNDDKQIVGGSQYKYYSKMPRIEITLEEVE